MTQKSYNIQALRGHEYSDTEFQQDMADADVIIPDNVLYTPRINDYVAQAIYDQNIQGLPTVINPQTNKNYTAEEARAEAGALRDQVHDNIKLLNSIKQ